MLPALRAELPVAVSDARLSNDAAPAASQPEQTSTAQRLRRVPGAAVTASAASSPVARTINRFVISPPSVLRYLPEVRRCKIVLQDRAVRVAPVDLTARIVTLRLAETFVISRESSDEDDVVQVELVHDGVTGFGEGAPIERYDESGESALAYLEAAAPLLGDDPFALEEIEARLPPGENAARAALDGALHDLQGKLLGVPAWKLLGLPRAGPPTSWTVWLGDPDDMARRAERAAQPLPPAEAEARRRRRPRRRAGARGARRSPSCR